MQTNPPRITLSWVGDPVAIRYTLYRKSRDATDWGNGTALSANATNYVDSNVAAGGAYEYWVAKDSGAYFADGYIYAGIEVPLVESRGKIVLLVDNTYAASLSNELVRLQQDLAGDGWTVLRHDVARMAVDPANTSSDVWAARSNELAGVKAIIKSDYNADPTHVKAVFLLGHVPVPYSGNMAPDDHYEHVGAWSADAFYGDLDGTWTDTDVISTDVGDQRTRNVPGDGKFDQTELPSALELQVGRVDFANMPAFSTVSEGELLRRYLNKDHNFRHKLVTAERRGLIDDHLGVQGGWEAFAANGWRSFAPFFGASNTFTGDWITTLTNQSYLWGYGCGAGTYTSCSGVGSTSNFVTNDTRVVFTMLFGSYFGDWDSQNNFLRAQLGTTTCTLASVWAGRPFWMFHHMALGEAIGFSARVTQNNYSMYSADLFSYEVHVALMGDPTLRMHPVAPPSNFAVTANGSGGVDLRWNPSPDSVVGYAIYRSSTAAGPFSRLNPANLVTGTNYTDSTSSACTYMVRAVKLEISGSGSYWNASQGIFKDYVPLPVLTIAAPNTNKVYGATLPTLTPVYSGFVNGDTPASLATQPVLTTTASASSSVGNYPISVNGAASTNYIIVYVPGTLTITPAFTTGLLTSSTNPTPTGQPVTFNMFLTAVAPGAGVPSGSVQFAVDSANAGPSVTLVSGSASLTTSSMAHGTHTVAAAYPGDGNFAGVTNLLSPAQVINSPPVARPDTIERDPTNGVKVAIATLLTNDSDLDGDLLSFLSVSATTAQGGTVVSNETWLFYTPPAGFTNTDSFTYSISDTFGATATATVTVAIRLDNGQAPNLSVTNLGSGVYKIRGNGIPGLTYRIQATEDLQNPVWQTLGEAMADSSGIFVYTDSPVYTQRFYRSAYP